MMATDSAMCRHCEKFFANRPRRLCWTCYYSPVRDQYAPQTSNGVIAGIAGYEGMHPESQEELRKEAQQKVGRLPDTYTNAMPGSAAKKEIMAQRARLKQALHHPLDLKIDLRVFPARIPGIDLDPRNRRS